MKDGPAHTGLRPVDIGDRPKVVGPLDDRPTLAWLPIDKLGLDDRYQRKLAASNWQSIVKIAQAFDWQRFTPILAAPAGDGRFAIIDGQHRTHAALMRGYEAVPAMVVPMDTAAQARAFSAVNGDVTAITIYHLFKAALFAQDYWAVRAKEIVEAAGCELMTYPVASNARRPRQITQIGLVRAHVEADRCALFTGGLRAISDSSNGEDPDAYASAILKQWLAALYALEDWTTLDMAGFLKRVDLVALSDHVAAMRKGQSGLAREPASTVYRRTLLAQMRRFIETGDVVPRGAP